MYSCLCVCKDTQNLLLPKVNCLVQIGVTVDMGENVTIWKLEWCMFCTDLSIVSNTNYWNTVLFNEMEIFVLGVLGREKEIKEEKRER